MARPWFSNQQHPNSVPLEILPISRKKLASSVDQGWASVNPGLIMLCAVKCGVARVEDFEPAVVESKNLRTVYIDPIIADLVGAGTAPPGSEA